MAGVFYFPLIGTPTAAGNLLTFFQAGTDTPLDVWTDSDLTIPWAQPITLNAAGESSGPIYVSASPSYKVVYTDSTGVAIPGYPVDFVAPSTIVNVTKSLILNLTNAQILALPTTPITVIPAPATGLIIKVFAATARLDTTAGVYTNVNTTYCAFPELAWSGADQWVATPPWINDSTTAVPLALATTALHTDAQKSWGPYFAPAAYAVRQTSGQYEWVANGGVIAQSQGEALALTVRADNNGSGNFTGGNAANSCRITVYYALESVA